ncbi:MAG: hypothetical protein VW258_14845, partial [Thalassolituus sp.]
LLEGCKQAVTLHENKDERRTAMEFFMSPADTLLAGYCKGVIESYVSYSSTRGYRCSKTNWYVIAKSIGSLVSQESVADLNGNYQRDVEDALLYGCK